MCYKNKNNLSEDPQDNSGQEEDKTEEIVLETDTIQLGENSDDIVKKTKKVGFETKSRK